MTDAKPAQLRMRSVRYFDCPHCGERNDDSEEPHTSYTLGDIVECDCCCEMVILKHYPGETPRDLK